MYKNLLTQPRLHDPKNFVYLARALSQVSPLDVERAIREIKDPLGYAKASLIGRMEKEGALFNFSKEVEIDQAGSYGSFGVLVELAREDLIKIAWHSCLCSPTRDRAFREFTSQFAGIIETPFQLLTNAIGHSGIDYNEFIFQGDPENRIVGVFHEGYDVFRKGHLETDLEAAVEIKNTIADILGEELPIIGTGFTRKNLSRMEMKKRARLQEQAIEEFYEAYESGRFTQVVA